jgi:diguanylate cyclase (GGDEF)-like protein
MQIANNTTNEDAAGRLIAHWASDPFDIVACQQEVLVAQTASQDPKVLAWAEFLSAFCAIRSGKMDDAEQALTRGEVLSHKAGEFRVQQLLRYLHGFSFMVRGDMPACMKEFREILQGDQSSLTEFDRAVIAANYATTLWMNGELTEAARRLVDGVEYFRERGMMQRALTAMSNLCQVLHALGDVESSLEYCDELMAMPETMSTPRLRIAVPITAVDQYLTRGRLDEALVLAAKIEAVLAVQPLAENEYQVPSRLVELYLATGDLNRAKYWLDTGDGLIRLPQHQRAYAVQKIAWASWHLRHGENKEALIAARDAVTRLRQDSHATGLVNALETLAKAAEACGYLQETVEAMREHSTLSRQLAQEANKSRHYVMDTRLKTKQMRHERDLARSEQAQAERHAQELEAINAQLAKNLAEVEALKAELAEIAVRDPLTGLHNRRHLINNWAMLSADAAKNGLHIVVALIDLDLFKCVNDTYGHAAGDEVLRVLANVLRRVFRPDDWLVRYGGEEFCVVCETNSVESIQDRLMTALHGLRHSTIRGVEINGVPLSGVTFSCGVAVAASGEAFESIAQRADTALYRAKEAGRARVMIG